MNYIELESFPFNSIIDDREYEASIFRNYFGKFLTTGVYFGLYNNYGDYSMKVIPDSGLNVKVKKGCGLINGTDFNLKNDTTLTLEMPIGNNRKDMVVVRFDDTLEQRKTKLYIKEGTETAFAELERTIDVYEICLAKIIVQDRALEVTIDDITDTRRDSNLCGIVTSLIDIDIQDVLDDITAKKDKFFLDLNIETEEEKAEFFEKLNIWFETIKDVIDENTAVHLLNLINSNTQKIDQNAQKINTNTENINANTQLINTKSDKKKTYNIEIDTNWTAQNKKTIQVQGIEETDIVNIYPVWSETKETRLQEKEEYNKISLVKSGENSIELTCDEETPNIKLNARIEVVY